MLDQTDIHTPTKTRKRRLGTLDLAGQRVVMRHSSDRHGTTYSIADLDEKVKNWLALSGLRHHLQMVEDEADAFGRLLEGRLPGRVEREKDSGEKLPSPWRRAIALALVEEASLTGKTMLPKEAEEFARGMNRSQLMRARHDPTVIRIHDELTGAERKSLSALLGNR